MTKVKKDEAKTSLSRIANFPVNIGSLSSLKFHDLNAVDYNQATETGDSKKDDHVVCQPTLQIPAATLSNRDRFVHNCASETFIATCTTYLEKQ